MAIRIKQNNLSNVQIVSEGDDAIDWKADGAEKAWEKYQEKYDMNVLPYKKNTQPTVFVCDFKLNGKVARKVKNSMLKGRDEDDKPGVTLGSWSHEVVRHTLKDIQNPADVAEEEKLKIDRDKSGSVHDDTLALLDQYGIITEIFTAYTSLTGIDDPRKNAKN